MRFLVDAQLPPALARFPRERGHQAEHVIHIGLARASDPAIWRYAASNGLILVTKDEDFVVIRALEAVGPPVVWLRMGNTRKAALMKHVGAAWPDVIAALQRGETIVEVA
jgi:predicted nuclease of predicted toxin-antitoxin system